MDAHIRIHPSIHHPARRHDSTVIDHTHKPPFQLIQRSAVAAAPSPPPASLPPFPFPSPPPFPSASACFALAASSASYCCTSRVNSSLCVCVNGGCDQVRDIGHFIQVDGLCESTRPRCVCVWMG